MATITTFFSTYELRKKCGKCEMSRDELFYKNYKLMSTTLNSMVDLLVIGGVITDIDRVSLLTQVIFKDPTKFYKENDTEELTNYLKDTLTETILKEVANGNLYSPLVNPTKENIYENIS